MNMPILEPLHVADLTPAEAYRFGLLCAAEAARGELMPLDADGYVLTDDATEFTLGL